MAKNSYSNVVCTRVIVKRQKDFPNFVPPTQEEWEKAKALSKLYELKVQGNKGRPYKDLRWFQHGALVVNETTGYLSWQSANHSVLWNCTCACGNKVVLTAQRISRPTGAYCCGVDGGPYKIALTKEQGERRDREMADNFETDIVGMTMGERREMSHYKPPPRPLTAQEQDEDWFPTGKMSQEIH